MKKHASPAHPVIRQTALTLLCLLILVLCAAPRLAFAQAPAPLVAIHVSELTQALETKPAALSTPTGAGTSGFEWWYVSWHYFVAYESLQEALRADGTPFVTVSDSDIAAGKLLNADGSPLYPILISLASEAVADNEIPPLRSYVSAGGHLFVGSSSFTRNPDGTSRGDFALAGEMGLHMANAGLLNWYPNAHLTKVADNQLTSHIPSGALNWSGPLNGDDVPWGVSPAHTRDTTRWAWQVVASGATDLADGDAGPLLAVNNYGLGRFIFHAEIQPLIGHDGFDPGMYEYLIYRRAIEAAFASFTLPIVKVSPWPFQYDAAFISRHDFENNPANIALINSSAQFENALGVKGDYYFCTGALRDDMGGNPAVISGLQTAVASYGATIGSHNGGLSNPANPALAPADGDYWHWGPDEALDSTPPGYPSGKAYASASILTSFTDLEGWLKGLDNGRPGCGVLGNCPRTFVSPYFNSTRDDSRDIVDQLGAVTMGEQKIGPFPHKTLSYNTPGKFYAPITLPVSDWYVGSDVAQAIDDPFADYYHTTASIDAAVDFYYNLGFLLNFYTHSPSNDGSVGQEYLTRSAAKANMWSTNAVGLHDWSQLRSGVTVTPAVTTIGTSYIATAAVTGATDPNSAVEMVLPQAYLGKVTVFLNGTQAAASEFRNTATGVKVRVGSSVATVRVQNLPNQPPVALNQSYATYSNAPLSQGAPGLLAGSSDFEGASLTAQLASAPSHGSLTLNPNGSFIYAPALNYAGSDSFSYFANDGTANSAAATVTITVLPALISVAANPASVTGGSSSQGIVTLSGAAPSGGYSVSLSGNASAVSMPSSVTVPAGSASASFAIATSTVTDATAATISAAYGSVTKTATLTVNPPAVSLSALSLSPASVTGGTSSTGTVTLSAAAPSGGKVVNLSDNSSATSEPVSVTVPAGSTSASFTITTATVTSTTTATISAVFSGVTRTATLTVTAPVLSLLTLNPTSVTGGTASQGTVTLSGAAPSGGIAVTLSDNASATSEPVSVTIPAGSSSASFAISTGSVGSSTVSTISAAYGGVTKTAALTVNPPAVSLSTLTLSPSSVTGGTSAQGTVTLSSAAPSGGLVVSLSDNSSLTGLPASVTVPAGSASASFSITTSTVGTSSSATISAVYGGVTRTASLTVNPPALSALTLNPASVTGGTSAQGTVTLSGAAPSGGLVVALSDNTSVTSLPASVTVPAGSTSASFTVSTSAVASSSSATISAVCGGVTKTAALTVNPPVLSTLTLNPTSVKGDNTSQGTVTLSGPAPKGGAVVTITDNSSKASEPVSATVPAGSTSASFTITTTSVYTTTPVTISALYGGVTKTVTLTVTR